MLIYAVVSIFLYLSCYCDSIQAKRPVGQAALWQPQFYLCRITCDLVIYANNWYQSSRLRERERHGHLRRASSSSRRHAPSSVRSVWPRQRPQPRRRSRPWRPQQQQLGTRPPRPRLCVESWWKRIRRAIAARVRGGARSTSAGRRGRPIGIRIATADGPGAARR